MREKDKDESSLKVRKLKQMKIPSIALANRRPAPIVVGFSAQTVKNKSVWHLPKPSGYEDRGYQD